MITDETTSDQAAEVAAPTGHPGEERDQPIQADAIPTPVDTRHPGERLDQPIPADAIPVAAPASAPDPVASIEHWAKKHGMWHVLQEKQKIVGARAPGSSPAQPVGMKFRLVPGRLNPKHDAFAQARAHHGWLPNHELTEQAFLAALEAPKAHVFR